MHIIAGIVRIMEDYWISHPVIGIIFRIENGKIAEQWCEMSDLQVVQQLGAKLGTS